MTLEKRLLKMTFRWVILTKYSLVIIHNGHFLSVIVEGIDSIAHDDDAFNHELLLPPTSNIHNQ